MKAPFSISAHFIQICQLRKFRRGKPGRRKTKAPSETLYTYVFFQEKRPKPPGDLQPEGDALDQPDCNPAFPGWYYLQDH